MLFSLNTAALIAADKGRLWHPFTQMKAWTADGHDPLVLVHGEGAMLRDSEGREYLDGNSSIWTNIHGHNHPKINAAIKAQLDRGPMCPFSDQAMRPPLSWRRSLSGQPVLRSRAFFIRMTVPPQSRSR
jgi:adenosylmethionine-8-amino-7-oxononanoate aminotransferase